jgi:hypothetical protein
MSIRDSQIRCVRSAAVPVIDQGRPASPVMDTLHKNSEACNVPIGTFKEPVTTGALMGDYAPHIAVDASLRFRNNMN